MYYKRWIKLFLIISIMTYICIYALYILVNPDQIFNNSLTKYKFEYTRYYSKHQYEKLKDNKYTLIFGTSRSQRLSKDALGINLLNFHNIYGQPGDILNFLEQLDEKQRRNINHIYYMISLDTMHDEISTIDYKSYGFFDQLKESFPLTNLSLKHLIKDILYNTKSQLIYYYIENDGSQFVYKQDQYAILNNNIKQNSNNDLYSNHSIQTVLSINKLCTKYNIPITYYTPTYTIKYTLNLNHIRDMWKRLLEGGIDEFYALYYIDNISNSVVDNRFIYFTDSSHLNYTQMNNVFKTLILNEDKDFIIKDTEKLNKYIQQMHDKYADE